MKASSISFLIAAASALAAGSVQAATVVRVLPAATLSVLSVAPPSGTVSPTRPPRVPPTRPPRTPPSRN